MRLLIFSVLYVFIRCDDYYEKRAKILDLEFKLAVGGNISLTDKENAVNTCLMKHKFDEVDYGVRNPEFYNFSRHFFLYKDKISESKVYQIIKAMPKGAALHLHDTAILGPDYMLNITYRDHLYVCFGTQKLKFRFSINIPNVTCDDNWQLMSDLRRTSKNLTDFDIGIKKYFTMVVENPDLVYPTMKESWTVFRNYFDTIDGLLRYMPVWKQYVYDFLKAFREDNVMYVELRTELLEYYELNGTVYDDTVMFSIYRDVIQEFTKEYPDFFGARLIAASSRRSTNVYVNSRIQQIKAIREKVPGLIVGFDLDGGEDLGRPLIDFVEELKTEKDMNFFFHAGETNWYGTPIDENLIDAVLLGAKRLGHAFVLTKHPVVMREVIERDIGIEVNVISNSVLSFVRDVRNHPLSTFLSHGLPVVLSSDDPGVWGANTLSDDFYVAFVGVASKHADLRMLKTLALNSLKYSALDPINKQKIIDEFHLNWYSFVKNFKCP